MAENNKKVLYIIIAVAVIVVVLAAGYLFRDKIFKKQAPPTGETSAKTETQTLGGEISKQVGDSTEKIPETNPFQATTNPFEEAKTNPYKDVYKNPFGQ